MTLIIAIPAKDGLVLASDSQVTTGSVRSTEAKIHRLNDYVLWSGSGELAVIQRVTEQLESFARISEPLASIRDSLAQMIRAQLEILLQLDFRTQFVQSNPEALLQLHPADFLFVEYRGDAPRILHVLTNGTTEWVSKRPAASGSGEMFAYALLGKYAGLSLDVERAKLLAYKVIEEAITVGAYGLGPPIDLWTVTSEGARQLREDEIALLEDAARTVREGEIDLLMRGSDDISQDPGESSSRDDLGA